MIINLSQRAVCKVLLALTYAYTDIENEEYKTIHDNIMDQFDKAVDMKLHGGA